MTRRSLFKSLAAAFVGSVVAKKSDVGINTSTPANAGYVIGVDLASEKGRQLGAPTATFLGHPIVWGDSMTIESNTHTVYIVDMELIS